MVFEHSDLFKDLRQDVRRPVEVERRDESVPLHLDQVVFRKLFQADEKLEPVQGPDAEVLEPA